MAEETLKTRVTRLEERVQGVCEKLEYLITEVNEIKDNHLTHIRADIAELKAEIKVVAVKVGAIVAIVSTVVTALVNYFL